MASGTFGNRPLSILVSNSFHYALSDGWGFVMAWYDPIDKTVTGYFAVRNASDFNTTTPMFTIDEPYRPFTNYGVPMIVWVNDGTISAYQGTIRSDGRIQQGLSSTATGAYGSFTYKVVNT